MTWAVRVPWARHGLGGLPSADFACGGQQGRPRLGWGLALFHRQQVPSCAAICSEGFFKPQKAREEQAALPGSLSAWALVSADVHLGTTCCWPRVGLPAACSLPHTERGLGR